MLQCEKGTKSWRVVESDRNVFREAPFEIPCQCRGLRLISREGECEGSAILRIAAPR
jgi:hypothetical protein